MDPGLDRHEWETEMQALEPNLEDAPAETLPELDGLIERMLVERGYALNDPVAREGDEREIVAEFLAARDVTHLVDRGDAPDPGDVASAINGYREIYRYLLDERSAP